MFHYLFLKFPSYFCAKIFNGTDTASLQCYYMYIFVTWSIKLRAGIDLFILRSATSCRCRLYSNFCVLYEHKQNAMVEHLFLAVGNIAFEDAFQFFVGCADHRKSVLFLLEHRLL